jgi:hypothetical protein
LLVGGFNGYHVTKYEDEMTANVRSALHECLVRGIEVQNVASLHNKHDNPINAGDDGIEGEGRPDVLVLSPYCMASMVVSAIIGSVESVVNRCDHNQKPGDDC